MTAFGERSNSDTNHWRETSTRVRAASRSKATPASAAIDSSASRSSASGPRTSSR